MNLEAVHKAQTYLSEQQLDAWVVCDFRGTNPVLARLLGRGAHLTRRVVVVVPAAGPVTWHVHAIEEGQFGPEREQGASVQPYRSHDELMQNLTPQLHGCRRLALEYSPGGRLPAVSWVDAGTVDMLRELGPAQLESSADLLQTALASWDADALAGHHESCAAVVAARDIGFYAIRRAITAGQSISELEVQRLIGEHLMAAGFDTDHPAIVGANAHSGDPHYAPQPETAANIGAGDWVLIDLWARRPGEQNIFADITWVATTAAEVTPQQQQVFDIVRRARDLIVERLHDAWRAGEPVQGWQLDRLARDHIDGAGFGEQFLHRTGHSLSPGPAVHGLGANLDDVESRDTRTMLPGTGFTIEPGIYLPDFGVRLEINVYVDPDAGPTVTTPVQDDIIRLA